VAAGLYAHERRFVRTFAPVSVVLFGAGVLFMYFLVLPVVLNFFVGFSMGIPMPETQPSWLQRLMIPSEAPTSQPASVPEPMSIPLLAQPPENAAPGAIWFDTSTDRLLLMTADGIRSLPMRVADAPNPVRSEFGLNFYVSFVLSLALAFGLAFELPVAVVFLVLTRIVPVAMFNRSRRYVVFGIFVAAAILTPPDVVSQILLAIPMILLFEGGLFFGRMIERNR
ncbi:MAG: twin-arginine translocase subunit TatC, partial [Phycisphaerae bacterium]|nr:twin-arginine translocase subunit TatC [Phycisphaerae bacterium]